MEDTHAAQKPPSQDAPAPSPKPTGKTSKASFADGIKSWGDAATALLKAVLLAMAIVGVAAVSGVAIWRDFHTRVLVVDVSPEAEKTLKALGADIDLRSALRDALNERVAGVEQVIAVQGLVIAGAEADAISFKPFGVELSTDDVTRVLEGVFGRPARPTVRLELLCAPLACNDPAARQATLVMSLSGESGYRTTSYPIMLGGRGLGRSLHISIQRIADTVLEQIEPLIASDLFLNRPSDSPEQRRADQIRAEGAAVAGRASDPGGCFADLVIGGSLATRGQLVDGVAAEERALRATNIKCKIHADTNIVFFLAWKMCSFNLEESQYANDQVKKALERLASLHERRGAIDDEVYFRIPNADLIDRIIGVVCPQTAPSTTPGNHVAEKLKTLLGDARAMLPMDAHTLMQHEILDAFWGAMQRRKPGADVAGRLSFEQALVQAVRSSQVNDPHPRELFVLQGRLATAMALASLDALDLPDPARDPELTTSLRLEGVTEQSRPDRILTAVRRDFDEAAVAYENASATTSIASFLEPVSDPEVFGLLADVAYAGGEAARARAAYARAVERFIEDDEPVEQVLPVIRAFAGWATVLIDAGACNDPSHPDPVWTDRWTQLGDRPPDVCRLAGSDDATGTPPLLATIRMMLGHMMECYAPPLSASVDEPDTRKRTASIRRMFGLLDCYDGKRNELAALFEAFGDRIDAELARALSARH